MTAAGSGRTSSSDKLAATIGSLELTDFQKGILRDRWLDQVSWMSRQARIARRRYLAFRVPLIAASGLTPAFVTLLLSSEGQTSVGWLFGLPIEAVRLLAFVTSLTVAACAGAEDLLKFGDRWRHYRRVAEVLKAIGWQYLTLNGAFRRYKTHSEAFTAFTERVEETLSEDLEGYLGAVSTEEGERSRGEIVV